jgi:chorismate mutase
MTITAFRQDAIDTLRDAIAEIDRDIVVLMRRRLEAACALGHEKRLAGRPITDPEREAAVLRHAALLARSEQLDPERVRDVFWCLIAMCRAAQLDANRADEHA